MKIICGAILLLLLSQASGQSGLDTLSIKAKVDSIVQEANRLYNHEKAAWWASDLVRESRKLRRKSGGYIVYATQDTMVVCILSKKKEELLLRYYFPLPLAEGNYTIQDEDLRLSEAEQSLWKVKKNFIEGLQEGAYDFTYSPNYDPNFIVSKAAENFVVYIIMGHSEKTPIPFGNDYYYLIDAEGEVLEQKKFHTRMVPGETTVPGRPDLKVSMLMHSHVKSSPYISATDICTYRLYAPYHPHIDGFSVFSSALGIQFKYELSSNSVQILWD